MGKDPCQLELHGGSVKLTQLAAFPAPGGNAGARDVAQTKWKSFYFRARCNRATSRRWRSEMKWSYLFALLIIGYNLNGMDYVDSMKEYQPTFFEWSQVCIGSIAKSQEVSPSYGFYSRAIVIGDTQETATISWCVWFYYDASLPEWTINLAFASWDNVKNSIQQHIHIWQTNGLDISINDFDFKEIPLQNLLE
jgi:hypothetical protein